MISNDCENKTWSRYFTNGVWDTVKKHTINTTSLFKHFPCMSEAQIDLIGNFNGEENVHLEAVEC